MKKSVVRTDVNRDERGVIVNQHDSLSAQQISGRKYHRNRLGAQDELGHGTLGKIFSYAAFMPAALILFCWEVVQS